MIPNQWYVVMDSDQVKDRPVGVTRMGEKLIQGDRPIVEYRRRRQELIEEATALSAPA
jgi:phenylpropionate dioxygenase-like ring-hydroxylating dioxygenase large terminal subunit